MQTALAFLAEATAPQESDHHLRTIVAWAQENLRYLEQDLTTRLFPHPF
jgi:hypothetical protein